MKKNLLFLLVIVLSIGLLFACSQGTQVQSSYTSQQSEHIHKQGTMLWPRTIVDAGGNKITLDEQPRRIAILHANYLEYFFSLGTPVIASAGASVGTAQYAIENYETLSPYRSTAEIIDLGSAREINLEAILEAQPDVIVTFDGHSGLDEIYQQLNKIAPVILLDFQDTWQNQTRACGEIVGKENAAQKIIKETEEAIASEHEVMRTKDKTIAIFRTNAGKAFVARGTSDYYATFGITAPQGYTFGYETFSLEAVAEMNPDYIIFMDNIEVSQGFVKSQESSSVWMNMDAVKNGNVVYFDDSLNTFGPLAMRLMSEKLMETIK